MSAGPNWTICATKWLTNLKHDHPVAWDASLDRNICMQAPNEYNSEGVQGEDCLYLSVYTPYLMLHDRYLLIIYKIY